MVHSASGSPRFTVKDGGKVIIYGNSANWNETTQGGATGSLHFDPLMSCLKNGTIDSNFWIKFA